MRIVFSLHLAPDAVAPCVPFCQHVSGSGHPSREISRDLDTNEVMTTTAPAGGAQPRSAAAISSTPVVGLSLAASAVPGAAETVERFARIAHRSDGRFDGFVVAHGEPAHALRDAILLVYGPDDRDAQRYALQIGAGALIHAGLTSDELLARWAAARAGLYGVPRRAAHAGVEGTRQLALSTRQRRLLAGLARGLTMAEVAAELGCSERHARRAARSLWNALGASNRNEGLVAATRRGLIPVT